MESKPRSDAKLKNLPEDQQAELFALFTATELRPAMSLEQVQAEVPLRHGFTVSLDTLSRWRSWWSLRSRMEAAKAKAEQVRLEFLRSNPDATPEDLERVGQYVFTAETMESGDVKTFVALAKLRLEQQRTAQDERRLKMLEARAAKAEEAEGVMGSDMSEEAKTARLREIFRMG